MLSEPSKVRPDSKVVAWLSAHESDFVVGSIILGELSFGILALPRGRKRAQLEQWFDAVIEQDRVFTVGCRRESPLGEIGRRVEQERKNRAGA